ncbi:hypothetical protein FQN49_005789, partial [Arthroderma sp. PD_2]
MGAGTSPPTVANERSMMYNGSEAVTSKSANAETAVSAICVGMGMYMCKGMGMGMGGTLQASNRKNLEPGQEDKN